MKGLKRLICYIFSFYLEKFPDSIELPEPSTDLKAWSFQLRKNYFCKLNIERPIAHKVRLSFFLCTLYIDNTFRACGKDSPDKKPRARLIYITTESQSDLNIYAWNNIQKNWELVLSVKIGMLSIHVLRPCHTVQLFLQLATLFYSWKM